MDVSHEHIEIVEGARGPKARIKGHRIRVVDVVNWYVKDGMSAEEIVDAFPTITRADVHAALAYYWDNQEELDHDWAERDAWVDAFREEHFRESPSAFQERRKQLEAEWRSRSKDESLVRQQSPTSGHVG